MAPQTPKNIIIIGGGFAGVAAAKHLLRHRRVWQSRGYRLILVSKTADHSYTPAYYEVATNEQANRNIHYPLSELLGAHCAVRVAEVTRLDRATQQVELTRGRPIPYEYVILASGAMTNYHDVPGLEEHALTLKEPTDPLAIRRAIRAKFGELCHTRPLNVVVGGGGFTGAELAAELVNFREYLAKQAGHGAHLVNVAIIQGPDRLLPGLGWKVSMLALRRLHRFGVSIWFNSRITRVDDRLIHTKNGQKIAYDILVWTGGVRPSPLMEVSGLRISSYGAADVTQYLQSSDPAIFVAGDAAALTDSQSRPLPAMAQPAEQSGAGAAHNILQSLRQKPLVAPRMYISGYVIPLTGRYAILKLRRRTVAGFFGWLSAQAVVLMYFAHIFPLRQILPRWLRFERSLKH